MEKNNKLIYTIIGVVLLIILVAGATLAWIVSALVVNNGNYNTRTLNFNVNFVNGTAISSVPTLGAATATPSNTAHLTVTASKATGSAPGNLTIYINTDLDPENTTTALLSSGAINYAVCIGTCADFTTAASTGTVSSATVSKEAILVNTPLTASPTNYNVYFWLDSSKLGDSLVGASYTGYISAEAVQTEG